MKLIIAAALCLFAVAAPAHAQDQVCPGDQSASEPPAGDEVPRLRFGVTPSGAAGQLGPAPSNFEPDDPAQILDALARLRPTRGPFVTHVYSSWQNEGPEEDRRLTELADRYAGAGYQVEFVLRYRPKPEREGDVAGYVEWVRHMVRLSGETGR